MVTNAGPLRDSLAALRKSSGPWRSRQGPVTTTGSTEQVLFKHHSEVHFCILPLPVHILKWAWHLPNSLNISFLQTVVPKPSFLLHSKGGGRWEATSKPFCEASHLCKAHQMLPEPQVVIEAEPGCKEYFFRMQEKKKNFFLPRNFLKSPSKLFPCPSSSQTPEPSSPKVVQRHWDTVAFPPQPH